MAKTTFKGHDDPAERDDANPFGMGRPRIPTHKGQYELPGMTSRPILPVHRKSKNPVSGEGNDPYGMERPTTSYYRPNLPTSTSAPSKPYDQDMDPDDGNAFLESL